MAVPSKAQMMDEIHSLMKEMATFTDPSEKIEYAKNATEVLSSVTASFGDAYVGLSLGQPPCAAMPINLHSKITHTIQKWADEQSSKHAPSSN